MIALYRSLARRYLLGKKRRSLITILGIALGVTMVVAVALTNGAILASYETLLQGVAGRADLQVLPAAGQAFPVSFLADVESTPGVKTAVPAIVSGSPVVFGEKKGNANFYGIDPARDALVRDYKLTAGRLPSGGREVAVTTDLARNLGLASGDRVKLLSTNGFAEFTVVGIFDAAGTVRGALGPFGVMRLPDAQQTFGKDEKLSAIDILVAAGSDPSAVEKALEDKLAGRARVGTPLERTRDMQKMLDSVVFSLTVAGSISLFAGAFIIYTNVAMGVAERRWDLSILRALGMRRAEVIGLVLAEAGVQGLVGAGVGLLWGYGLASTMAQQLTGQFLAVYGTQAAQVILDLPGVISAVAVGVGISLFAAYGPARTTVGISPVEAMRPGDVAANGADRHARARILAGLALIGAAAVFLYVTWPREGMLAQSLLRLWGISAVVTILGVVVLLPAILPALNRFTIRPLEALLFGVTGRLAADNLVRQPSRTTATAAALMVSLTFMVGMGGMGYSQRATFDRWFEKTVGWDLNVSTSYVGAAAQVEMAPGFVKALGTVPGVELAAPQKMGQVVLGDGDPAFLEAFDHRLLRRYSNEELEEGSWPEAADAMERGGSAIVSPAIARRLRLEIGDTITLPTPAGERGFRIVALLKDVTGFGGTVQLDWGDYSRYWDDETASNVAVVVTDKGRVEEVRRAILDRWGTSTSLIVRSNREFWAELRAAYDSFYSLMDGLTWIAILVAGLAIANTLFSSLIERRREIGILRAVGTRRGEVMQVVVGEAIGTGLIGGVFGVLLGLVVQALFIASSKFTTGADIDLLVPWGPLATAAVVALVFAPLVGLLPARWAARLDIVEALRYE